jgi:hypothetical protein
MPQNQSWLQPLRDGFLKRKRRNGESSAQQFSVFYPVSSLKAPEVSQGQWPEGNVTFGYLSTLNSCAKQFNFSYH